MMYLTKATLLHQRDPRHVQVSLSKLKSGVDDFYDFPQMPDNPGTQRYDQTARLSNN